LIRSFGDKLTEEVYHGRPSQRARRLDAGVGRAVVRKLDMIEAAARLEDLRSPPGNGLEALRGDLAGFHSIRVNDQWRIVFRWSDLGAEGVRLVDDH
jgi:proteic killer suppression protein